MKPLLVIFHLYYEDQLEYFISRMSNITCPEWDLLVTGEALSPRAKQMLGEFKSDFRFMEVESYGYDIWPFVKAVKAVNLDQYSLVMKIHTKNFRQYRSDLFGVDWREHLVGAMLRSRKRFDGVLACFDEHPEIGMACSAYYYKRLFAEEDLALLDNELERVGLMTQERRFCVGTMFIVRASLLKWLQSADYCATMFPANSHTGDKATLAHVVERVLSLLVPAQGYETQLLYYNFATRISVFFRLHCKGFFSKVLSVERRGEKQCKYLTVFGLSIRLDDGK